MFADVTRDSFNAAQNYLRVLAQQGRALLDADFNEQVSILHHWLTELARDLHGEHWGPSYEGFRVQLVSNVLSVTEGRYYVAGLPCEVRLASGKLNLPYTEQEDYPNPEKLPGPPYLVYLDVWERHLTVQEETDGAVPLSAYVDPFVRDPGLGHLDTTTRTRLVWQVKAESLERWSNEPFVANAGKKDSKEWMNFKELLKNMGIRPGGKPLLAARALKPQPGVKDPCVGEAELGYRGQGNRLYRVEIHDAPPQGKVTFKWAVDNASTTFPLNDDYTVAKGHMNVRLHWAGRDLASRLKRGDWVELIDDTYSLRVADLREVRPLLQVSEVSSDESIRQEVAVEVALEGPPEFSPPPPKTLKRPFLRRWGGNVQEVQKVQSGDVFVGLCDGVEVRFQNFDNCRRGDYWLIPARPATADILWPRTDTGPESRPPRNPPHAYAPLLLVYTDKDSGKVVTRDLRRIFEANAAPPPSG